MPEAPSTTCSLVSTWPSSSITTPDPAAVPVPGAPPGPAEPRTVALIDTTPARRRAYTSLKSTAVAPDVEATGVGCAAAAGAAAGAGAPERPSTAATVPPPIAAAQKTTATVRSPRLRMA